MSGKLDVNEREYGATGQVPLMNDEEKLGKGSWNEAVEKDQ